MVLVPYNQTKANDTYNESNLQRGGIQVFRGRQFQKGYGIGNILSGLFRSAVPLLKKGAASLGKAALETGVNVLNDGLQGKNISSSIKQNAQNAGKKLLNRTVRSITEPMQYQTNTNKLNQSQQYRRTNKNRKRKKQTSSKPSVVKRRRTIKQNQSDIFG